jgi:hypothetical protein
MSLVYTSLKIKYKRKEKCYLLETRHEHGAWVGGTSGQRIYEVGSYLVLTQWGNGKPIAVFESKAQMMTALEIMFGLTPVEE